MSAAQPHSNVSVDYEQLSVDTVRQLHEKFVSGIEAKARKAVPEDATDPELLFDSLENFLIASVRKGIDVKPADLAELARSGKTNVDARTEEVKNQLHIRCPQRRFPSPQLLGKHKQQVARAAANRNDPPAVQEAFGDADRIYLRLKDGADAEPSETQKKIAEALPAGYRITDYSKGFATDAAGKQQFKIGRLLKNNQELLTAFINDSSRTMDSLLVVISRQPADIATMSTGRPWGSCMGPGSALTWKYVPRTVKNGSLIAYLVSGKDPDITSPLSRILITRYNKVRKKHRLRDIFRKIFRRPRAPQEEQQQIFVPFNSIGIRNPAFSAAVEKFVEETLNEGKQGKFKPVKGAYKIDAMLEKKTTVRREQKTAAPAPVA
jgi:hypothetical protein